MTDIETTFYKLTGSAFFLTAKGLRTLTYLRSLYDDWDEEQICNKFLDDYNNPSMVEYIARKRRRMPPIRLKGKRHMVLNYAKSMMPVTIGEKWSW